MNSPTYFYIYGSSATQLFKKEMLLELLAKSRENNARLGITGLLLYRDGNFLQVLEGDKKTVQKLVIKIEGDPRHRGIIKLLEGTEKERQFPEWSMGFRDLESAETRATPGFNEFLNLPLEKLKGDESRCWRLLRTFRTVTG